ncbi:MAG: hypothetical protein ACRD01_03685 [Terriglobales bacterium]
MQRHRRFVKSPFVARFSNYVPARTFGLGQSLFEVKADNHELTDSDGVPITLGPDELYFEQDNIGFRVNARKFYTSTEPVGQTG